MGADQGSHQFIASGRPDQTLHFSDISFKLHQGLPYVFTNLPNLANMPTCTLFLNQFTSQYHAIYPYFLGLALTTRREWHGRPREPSIHSQCGRPDQTLRFSDLASLLLSHGSAQPRVCTMNYGFILIMYRHCCLFVCSRVVYLYYMLPHNSRLCLQYSLWATHSLHYLRTKLCVSLISLCFYCPIGAVNHVCVQCTMG